jgi:hypothetical protein
VSHRKHARLRVLGSPLRPLDLTTAKPAPKRADPIYATPEYRQWRTIVIRRAGGRCQDPECRTPERTGIRLFADHVKELKDGGAPFDPDNGLARCGACHTRKTARERAKRMARRY